MDIIYTVAYGEAFTRLLPFWSSSLRRWGDFTGKIIIFTDDRNFKSGDPSIEVRYASLPSQEPGEKEYWAYRSRIDLGLTIDLDAADHLGYFDTDTLAVADISPLFDCEILHYHLEEYGITSIQHSNAFFDPEELTAATKAGVRSISAANWVIPATAARAFLTTWLNAFADKPQLCTKNVPAPEQAALNLLLYRKQLSGIPYEDGWVYFPKAPNHITKDAIILHFVGRQKLYIPQTYKILEAVKFIAPSIRFVEDHVGLFINR